MKKRNGWKWALGFAILFTVSTVSLLTSSMYDDFVRWPYAAGCAAVLWVLALLLRSRAKQAEDADVHEAAQKTANVNNTTPPLAEPAPAKTAADAAEENVRYTRPRIYEEKPDRRLWYFYLTPPDDVETQKQLHDLKIKIKADGVDGELLAAPEDIGYAFRFDGLLLGTMCASDGEWLRAHEDDLETWTRFDLYGGDTDRAGCLRPVTTRITAKFSRDDLDPPPCGPLPLLPSSVRHGDEVVYVSSTKKIHRSLTMNCSVNLRHCTPMLYEEALRDGCVECKNCFL